MFTYKISALNVYTHSKLSKIVCLETDENLLHSKNIKPRIIISKEYFGEPIFLF